MHASPALSCIFVGGPGRSGTSFVAERLSKHPEIASAPDVELKLFTEKNGLLDLYHAVSEPYSPNRAQVALQQFRTLAAALIEGRFGQTALAELAPVALWQRAFDRFTARLQRDGHPVPQTAPAFHAAAHRLVIDMADIARAMAARGGENRRASVFPEKTPHALLECDFLNAIAPGARFVHVMRDPRSIARSLRGMRWGPDRLDTCARWVASYCETWLATQARAARDGLGIAAVHIEDLCAAPEDHARFLCRQLGLAVRADLFERANLGTLNAWADTADRDERAFLDTALAGWVAHFGYLPDRVGVRGAAGAPADQAARDREDREPVPTC